MTQNPFESPLSDCTHIDGLPKTFRLEPFKVDLSTYDSRFFTPEQLVAIIHEQVSLSCSLQGLIPSEETEPFVLITGNVTKMKESSHSFWELFFGITIEFQLEGFVIIQEDQIHPFNKFYHLETGPLTGSGKGMLENSISQFSFWIASKAASRSKPGIVQNNLLSIFYLLGTLIVAALASILSKMYCSPIFEADLSTPWASSRVPGKVAAVVVSGFLIVLGLSFALVPKRILKGAVLRWIMTNSGKKTELGFRSSFFFLALFFIMVYLFALLFKG